MVPDVSPLVEPLGTLLALEAVLVHLVRLHHVGLHLLRRHLLGKEGYYIIITTGYSRAPNLTQCCGSMTFWCGSGCGYGSFYFHHWPSRCQQKTNFKKKGFLHIIFFTVLFHHFSQVKSQKEVTKEWESRFSYYICLMIEGSGSIPLTNGSGSRRPNNTWIRWIRIRNTALTGLEYRSDVRIHDLPSFGYGSGSRSST
jgi:hypothetical protein